MPVTGAKFVAPAVALTLLALTLLGGVWLLGGQASAGSSIIVNSTSHPGAGVCDLTECTLHEALGVANANNGQDTITFDLTVFPPGAPAMIAVSGAALPFSSDPDGVIIDGTGAGVIIDGIALAATEGGLVFHSAPGIGLSGVVLRSLTVRNFPGIGIHICGGPIASLQCDEDLTGTELTDVSVTGNGDEGIEIQGRNVSNTTLDECDSSSNAGAGARVRALANLTHTSVTSCSAIDNGTQGVQLRGATGAANTAVSDVMVTGNNNDGVWLRSPGDITDSEVDQVTAVDNATGVHIDATGSATGVTFSSISSNANVTGIKIEADQNLSGIDLSGVTTNDNTAREGVWIDAGGSISDGAITDCDSNRNANAGVSVNAAGSITHFTVTDCTANDNTNQGLEFHGFTGVEDVTVENMTATGNNNDGVWIKSSGGNNVGTTVSGTTAIDNNSGIHLDAGGQTVDASLTNNLLTDNLRGIRLEGAGGIIGSSAFSNTLLDNTTGIEVEGLAGVHFNRISGNSVGARETGAGTLDAENNWWGCNAGPDTPGCDTTEGAVDGDPWLLLELTVDPAAIATNGATSLSADVTSNSDGADTSSQGAIMDSTPITFETDLGSVGSKEITKGTLNGSAEATLTADEGPGTATASASLDNETVSDMIEVTPATPTPSPTPSPTDAPSPSPDLLIWGDHNCSGSADPVDALLILRFDAGLNANTGECPNLGQVVDVKVASPHPWGDVDCGGDVTPVDSLKILRYDAGLGVTQALGCPLLGAQVAVAE